jgi:hypothetical protein
MGDDDKTRRLILARRARFVAAALASVAATTTAVGVGTEACGGTTEPGNVADGGTSQVCLRVAPDGSGQQDSKPQVCLEPPYVPPDAATEDANDAGEKEDGKPPQPCLSPPRGDF